MDVHGVAGGVGQRRCPAGEEIAGDRGESVGVRGPVPRHVRRVAGVGRVEGLDEQGAILGGQSGMDDQAAVVVPLPRAGPASVSVDHLTQPVTATQTTVRGDEPVKLTGRGMFGLTDPFGLAVDVGDPTDGADLGVGQPTAREGVAQCGELFESVPDAEVLIAGAQAGPALPRQPVCAGADPRPCPALAAVERGQCQQPGAHRG